LHRKGAKDAKNTMNEEKTVIDTLSKLDCGYRLDVVVEKAIILDLKVVETILPIHEAQILTYLKLSGIRLGILLNFNVPYMKNGIRRMVLGL
jgi:GxxExxY protein